MGVRREQQSMSAPGQTFRVPRHGARHVFVSVKTCREPWRWGCAFALRKHRFGSMWFWRVLQQKVQCGFTRAKASPLIETESWCFRRKRRHLHRLMYHAEGEAYARFHYDELMAECEWWRNEEGGSLVFATVNSIRLALIFPAGYGRGGRRRRRVVASRGWPRWEAGQWSATVCQKPCLWTVGVASVHWKMLGIFSSWEGHFGTWKAYGHV